MEHWALGNAILDIASTLYLYVIVILSDLQCRENSWGESHVYTPCSSSSLHSES